MRTRSMIRLDAALGLPLCAAASFACLLVRLVRPLRRGPLQPPERVLVTKFLGLGSVLLATPLLRRLRETWPEAKISFLTFDANAAMARRLPNVDEVIVVHTSGGLLGLLLSVPRLLSSLRRRRFDLALDLEFYSRLSNLVTWGSGAHRRTGFFVRARWRGSLLTDPVYFNPTLPYGEAVLALLRPLGLEPEGEALLDGPSWTEDEELSAWSRLATRGVPADGTLVVINPNASDLCEERRWPAERFSRLVARFRGEVAQADRFVFIGVEADRASVREVLAAVPDDVAARCLDLAGRTTLLELSVLLRRSALLITNDSGPLHLAASLGVPTVSLYGPETPSLYGPVGPSHLVFYAGHWCSPCLSVYNAKIAMCDGENECMRRIGLEQVIERTAAFCREQVGLAPPLLAERQGEEATR
jgi:ADP-heptose:LPS heptosyltransferase